MKKSRGSGVFARSKTVQKHTSGSLEAWGGIVSGTVQDFAEAFAVHPEQVVRASRRVPLMVDTAESKEKGKDRARPTDPTLRCLALTTEHAATLREIAQEL